MLDFIREIWSYFRTRKKYWLAPVIVIMVLFGGLIVLTQGSAVAPFIYTIFCPGRLSAHVHSRHFRLLS